MYYYHPLALRKNKLSFWCDWRSNFSVNSAAVSNGKNFICKESWIPKAGNDGLGLPSPFLNVLTLVMKIYILGGFRSYFATFKPLFEYLNGSWGLGFPEPKETYPQKWGKCTPKPYERTWRKIRLYMIF